MLLAFAYATLGGGKGDDLCLVGFGGWTESSCCLFRPALSEVEGIAKLSCCEGFAVC